MEGQMLIGTIAPSILSATVYGGMSPGESQTVLIPKTISQNGIYRASDDNADGYSAVTVNVQNDSTSFVIREKDNILKYNKVYLNDVWAAYGTSYETSSRVEHIENGDFLNGSGSIWRMNNGVIQPVSTNDYNGIAFTQPITLTTETTINIRYSYNSSSTMRGFWLTLWENVDPTTIQPGSAGAGFSTGDLLQFENIVGMTDPAQAPPTLKSINVSLQQGKTIWIHLSTTDVIPLITEIWFE